MNSTFSSRLKELRNNLNITQAKLADELGTTQAALSAYEKGERVPSFEILISIAQKFKISIDWLCGLSDFKSLNAISTYSDAFKLLVELCSTKYECEDTSVLHVNIFHDNDGICFLSQPDDENFTKFFSEWKNIYDLYSNKTIDNELYNLWLEKKYKEYEKPINYCPF